MPVVPHVRVGTLHENTRLGLTLGVHLPSHVEQVHPFPHVSPRLLNLLVPVDVGEEPKAEPAGTEKMV